ncbi:hypothetical protein BD310DRAFT_953029 [Dichomitus squalens]|uniref:N-acetyltransferase domain-containing protein n=1 Tax=Dichomitus squalens TaxID=114155 RepID=A0A4V2K6D7_9APHY|nr:hypothetical protein BD310DRAFT_953029 [Dichomitus squalens]
MALIVRQVIQPSEDELGIYSKLLAEAFGYAFFGGALNNDKALQEPMMSAHMNAALLENVGEVDIAELPDVGVVGVAVWFHPGHEYLDSDSQLNAGHNQVMTRLSAELQSWWKEFLETYGKLTDRVLGHGVKLGAYHLQLIGVSPVHQRKGVATALMRYIEAKACKDCVPCTVETVGKTNISIYEAMGYLVKGTGPIKTPPPHTGTFEMAVLLKHTEEQGSVE